MRSKGGFAGQPVGVRVRVDSEIQVDAPGFLFCEWVGRATRQGNADFVVGTQHGRAITTICFEKIKQGTKLASS